MTKITGIHNFIKQWSTHLAVLTRVVEKSEGPVLEIGAGLFSTPVLHWMCMSRNRKLVTLEDQEEFFVWARQFRSGGHSIRLINTLDDFNYMKRYDRAFKGRIWGVVFIDHGDDARRGPDAIKFKDIADYVVLHDTNPALQKVYSYDTVWQHFQYRYNWTKANPHTSVVSNFKELDNLW